MEVKVKSIAGFKANVEATGASTSIAAVVVVEGEEPVVRQYTRHPGAVAVVVMRGEAGVEEILLERQYRHPVRASL